MFDRFIILLLCVNHIAKLDLQNKHGRKISSNYAEVAVEEIDTNDINRRSFIEMV